ncbi:MAG: hypothetical protein JWR77_2449, partial [Rhizorhabdus sp.]|nr:hypothetical protein [Rhizorhabdus sp.]
DEGINAPTAANHMVREIDASTPPINIMKDEM